MLINAPQPEFPSAFEVYDPQIDDNIRKSSDGISGSRTYEWILIPRNKGRYTIPEFCFVYFDPTSGQYITKRIPKQEVVVDKNDAAAYDNGVSSNRPTTLNNIHPITKLHPAKDNDTAGAAFYIIIALIATATVCTIAVFRKRRAAEQDVAGMRMKRAVRMAHKRLKKAEGHLKGGDTGRFYEEIYRAIWGCLADKYNIPLADLNRDTVSACLLGKNVPQEQHNHIMQVLQDVDMARFAPIDPEAQKQKIYDEALQMIASI